MVYSIRSKYLYESFFLPPHIPLQSYMQCFLDGKLLPSPSDVKIELVPEVSALMEYPIRDMDPSSSGLSFTNNLKQESR